MPKKKKVPKQERYGLRELPHEFNSGGAQGMKAVIIGKMRPREKQIIDAVKGDVFVSRTHIVGSKGTMNFYFYQEEKGRKVMRIPALYIPPSQRSKGYGQKLVNRAIEIARKRGAEVIKAQTREKTQSTAPIFHILQKNGFKIVERPKSDTLGTLVIMEKEL